MPSASCLNAASIWIASSRVGLRMRTLIVFAAGNSGESLNDGNGEREGFACAGLRSGDHVAAFQQRRNGLRLDGRWLDEFVFSEVVSQCGAQIEFREMIHCLCLVFPGEASRIGGRAIEGCAAGDAQAGVYRQAGRHLWQLFRSSKIRSTSKFGASGTGCCNVRASNFRPAKIHPANGKLNVDSFRIASCQVVGGSGTFGDGGDQISVGANVKAQIERSET